MEADVSDVECLYPYHDADGTWFPCGHCLPCRIRHVREWTVRILHEFESFNYRGLFLTLTYRDECLPRVNGYASLRKSDLQKYFKRVRKILKGRKIKYFACGEYGESCIGKSSKNGLLFYHGRPHYHVLMLGVDYNDVPVLRDEWLLDGNEDWRWSLPHYDPVQKKIVSYAVGDVDVDSIRYVVGYVQKKWKGKKNTSPFETTGCENYFQLASQGFGLDWLKKNYEKVIDHPQFSLETNNGVRRIGLPQYYKRKLGLDAKGRRLNLLKESEIYNRYLAGLEEIKEDCITADYQAKAEKRALAFSNKLRDVSFVSLVNNVDCEEANYLLHKKLSYGSHFFDKIDADQL